MTKTIDEVRSWLDSMVGTVPPDLSDRDYDGQCVALIKNLLNFLGVPDPYSGRGNAKDFCERLDAEDFAEAGAGILNVWEDNNSPVVDSQYGHIWVQIGSDTWESNNYGSLHVSKDTLIAQPQQVWNLDKWLTNNGAGSATKGLIKMYLIFCIDTKRWYVSNGVEVRYVKTGRVLNNYQDKWAKLGLPTDTMYQAELDAEFGKNATDPNRDVSKG